MKWSKWSKNCINDRKFWHYFRILRDYFKSLYKKIEMNISSENFKSESFIKGLEEGTHGTAT